MPKHLFLFTIGPVQSFIAQARKTQDLYAGSQILTELIKDAINEIGKKDNRKNIIFPHTYPGNDKAWNKVESLPNRFIVIVNEDTNLKKLGQDLEDHVRNKWLQISNKAIFKCIAEAKEIKVREAFKEQIKQHLEIFWLFQPIENEDYKLAFQKIEQHLRAIKNVRVFQQYQYNGSFGEKGRKCNVDGERNALFFGDGTNKRYFQTSKSSKSSKWNPDACVLKGVSRVKVTPNEGLSGVSFVKRFYDKQGFPSTAKIALLNLEANQNIQEEISKLRKLVNDFDHQLLYEENLTKKYFEKHGLDKEAIPRVKHIISNIKQEAKSENIKMSSYYALLSFDGDSMGEWLSKAINQDQHNNFSKLLMEFAQKAKEKVDSVGQTVYAGGDDFLGFVNLDALFEVIESLKTMFDEEVASKTPINNGGKPLTMSMGVVIAHYKIPLGIVVKRAKEAEKAAKNSRERKNSIAIDFITHSGSNRQGIIPFGQDGETLQKVKFVFDNLKENFSDKWIRNFAKTFYGFTDLVHNPILDEIYRPLAETELKRLVLRACNLKGEERKKKSDELQKNVYQLFEATDFNYSNFTEMLYITSALVAKTSN